MNQGCLLQLDANSPCVGSISFYFKCFAYYIFLHIRAGSGGCFMGVSELKDTTYFRDLMKSRLLLLDSDDPINSLP